MHAALLLPQLLSYVASKFPGSILVYVRVGWLGRWFVMLVWCEHACFSGRHLPKSTDTLDADAVWSPMLYPYFICPTRRPPSRYVQGRLSKRMFQRGSSALMEQVDTMKEQVDTMKVVKRKLTMPLLLVNLAVSLVSGGV